MEKREGSEFDNQMELVFDSRSENEGFARVAVAAFMTQMNPVLEEVSDVKTAVSEAVTNAVIHGYGEEAGKRDIGPGRKGAARQQETELVHDEIRIRCGIRGRELYIEVSDHGVGIENVERAMEPLFTTKPDMERSGMGFAFMQAFMDEVKVESEPGCGTWVKMKKTIGEDEKTWTTQSL